MSEIDSSMDLFINPSISNSTLNQLSALNSKSQAEQIDDFEKVFDDVNEQFEQNINDLIKTPEISEKEDKTSNSETTLLSLLGNNFGPPAGLNIEDFDYSLIQ
ncbi:hypothetical protein IJ818_02840 [bacterium]|nr:hypothetical protein [bacterium]